MSYTKAQIKKRRCLLLANVLHCHYEEGTGVHSRVFEVLIPDELVIVGQSQKGKEYREHVVPCALIRDECMKMYEQGYTIDQVAEAIERHVVIVKITFEERKYLDKSLGLKTTMPLGWKFNKDDIFARLHVASIKFTLSEEAVEENAA